VPELPEVQTVVTSLQNLVGQRIASIDLKRIDILTPPETDLPALLTGRSIRSITRRGKRIVFTLDDGQTFYIHLGMTGRLTLEQPGDAIPRHTHLILRVAAKELRFCDPRRFGGIFVLPVGDVGDANMGPEPLSLTPRHLTKLLARTHRPIKSALLDQRLIAGLGNIYVDESLHRAGIHPLAITDSLTTEQIARLNRAIKQVLRRAIASRGSSLRDYVDADGNAGGFQKLHRVYAREGKPCDACRTPIGRIVLSGRSTHFCPKCQPNPNRQHRAKRLRSRVS
jgi:formamidopyrimidine-DNA glycosylase